MKHTSKDLLQLENNSSFSSKESALLVCKNESVSQGMKSVPDEKPVIAPVPPSKFLTKMKDFLGVMAEANERLKLDSKDNSSKDYDIEVLSGNESQYIEMDLILGVADLNTPEAVAAAENVVSGNLPVIPIATSDSDSESDSSSSSDEKDEDESDVSKSEEDSDEENSNSSKGKSFKKPGHGRSVKRPKIVEV